MRNRSSPSDSEADYGQLGHAEVVVMTVPLGHALPLLGPCVGPLSGLLELRRDSSDFRVSTLSISPGLKMTWEALLADFFKPAPAD